MFDTQAPYIASYILLRKDNKIAFVLRENTSWMSGFYGLPSGKVEKNENFSSAATREGNEEVGVVIKADDLIYAHMVHRHSEDMDWVDVYFEVKRWQGEVINAEPHMHSEVAWLDPKNLPENTVPSVKAAIEAIEKGQKYSEYGWDS
ncbi:NUDIX domain-containing protein [Candidatus Saccharibacteria bacterium]|nr:NUDIX domain-containing protein [Candidatus Saccharibacteria bacterium]